MDGSIRTEPFIEPPPPASGSWSACPASCPRDFELECEYTTTGGTTYKSVSFRFDESEDGEYSNFVYTSAHAPGPKVHAAFTRHGKTTYPAEGRRGFPVEVGKRYRLRFAVRDNLVNVWLDDEFMVAYRYPDRRLGFLSLSGYDSTVAFDWITVRSLPEDTELVEANNKVIASRSDAEMEVDVAAANLAASQAQFSALESTIAADTAKYDSQVSRDEVRRRALAAAQAQARARKAEAEHRMLADLADDKKLKAAQQQLESATQTLADLAALPEDAPATYESIPRRQESAGVARAQGTGLSHRVLVHQHWPASRPGSLDRVA